MNSQPQPMGGQLSRVELLDQYTRRLVAERLINPKARTFEFIMAAINLCLLEAQAHPQNPVLQRMARLFGWNRIAIESLASMMSE